MAMGRFLAFATSQGEYLFPFLSTSITSLAPRRSYQITSLRLSTSGGTTFQPHPICERFCISPRSLRTPRVFWFNTYPVPDLPELLSLRVLCGSARGVLSPRPQRTPRLFWFNIYQVPGLPDLLFLRVLCALCERISFSPRSQRAPRLF